MSTFSILCKTFYDPTASEPSDEWNFYYKCLNQAEEEITVKMMKKHITNEIALGRGSKFQNALHKSLQVQAKEMSELTAKKHNNGYLWITINPKPEVKFEDFRKFMAKISKKTCFEEYFYVFEQRSETYEDAGKGFHSHMLVKRNLKYKPIKCKQNIQQSCKKIVGNVHNEHHLNIQTIGHEFACDKCEYMCGNKDPEKQDKQAIDEMWRSDLGIQGAYYSSEKIILI